MKFDYNKLKSLSFTSSTIDRGTHGVHFEIDGICLKTRDTWLTDEEQEQFNFGATRVEEFKEGLANIGIETWEKFYNAPLNMEILDGESWSVEVQFEDKFLVYEGVNGYPENWMDFLQFINEYYPILDQKEQLKKFVFEMKSVEKFKVGKEISKVIGNEATMTYYEKIVVDRESGTYTSIRGISEEQNATLTIKVEGSVEILLDDIAELEDKPTNKKVKQPKNNQCNYTIDAEYENGEIKHFEGGYNRLELPANWEYIVDCFREFEDQMSGTMALNKNNFIKGLLKDEFIYLSVVYDQYSDQTYYYRTADESIKPGDAVLVPVGKDNNESVAYVVKKEIFKQLEVPLPLEKTKEVIRKLEEEEQNQ